MQLCHLNKVNFKTYQNRKDCRTFEQYCVAEVLHQCDFVGLPTGGGAAGGAVFAGQEAGAVETGRGGFESECGAA